MRTRTKNDAIKKETIEREKKKTQGKWREAIPK